MENLEKIERTTTRTPVHTRKFTGNMAQQSTTGHKIDDVVLLNRRTTVEVDWNGGKTIQHSMYNEPPMIWLHDKEVTFRSGDPGERELHLEKNKSNGALRVIKTIKKDSTSLDAFYREVYGMGMCKTAPEVFLNGV